MRNIIAETKNLKAVAQTSQAVRTQPTDLPGIVAIVGEPGLGKTSCATWLRDRIDAVFLTATSLWTPRTMLDLLARELRVDTRGLRGVVFDRIIERLASCVTGTRSIIIDEADYLIDRSDLLSAARDIHDMSGSPLFVLGMGQFAARVQAHQQFASRIAQIIPFVPADLDDARSVAGTCCDVTIADDLLTRIVEASGGSLRRIKVNLLQVETWAARKDLERVDVQAWGAQAFASIAPKKKGGAA